MIETNEDSSLTINNGYEVEPIVKKDQIPQTGYQEI